jgi:hypothetical protein
MTEGEIVEPRDHKKMKQDLFLAFLASYLRYPFESLRDYFASVQDLFGSERKRMLEWMDRQTAGLSNKERDRFYEWHGVEYSQLEDSFPNIHKNSLFIAAYSELENKLTFICRAVAAEKGSATPVFRQGGLLEQIKSYLQKEIGIKWPIAPQLWDEIIKIRRIRNAIVHKGGWLYESTKVDKELVKYINEGKKNVTLLKTNDAYRIQLTDSFIPGVLDTFERLLSELFAPISDSIREKSS